MGKAMFNQAKISSIQTILLKWYDENARDLPWRKNPSAYQVFVSEIMLQQTRVDTVIPYYERFLSEFPSIASLAIADDERLYKVWQGLGYYSRAKNMKKAAKMIMDHHHGIVPSKKEELLKLPGIGAYSSGSIGSIAYEERVCAVDGNVKRVFARLFGIEEDIGLSMTQKKIEQLVTNCLPTERIGDFNQSLMELGATVCLPNGLPRCDACPLQHLCVARIEEKTLTIPLKTITKPRKVEKKTVFVMEFGGKYALLKRPKEGLLSNLWEFPNVDGHLEEDEIVRLLKTWGVICDAIVQLESSKHIFSHIEWNMRAFFVHIQQNEFSSHFTWVSIEEISKDYSVPTAFKTYWNRIKKQEKDTG